MNTLQRINAEIVGGNFNNAELDYIMDAVRYRRSQIVKQNTGSMVLGTAVKFTSTRNGQLVRGKVKKVNRKFILVDTGTTVWRVPANMLERA